VFRLSSVSLLSGALILYTLVGSVVVASADTTPKPAPQPKAHAQSDERIGLVLPDFDGTWYIERGSQRKNLTKGDAVYEGWKINRSSATGTIKIKLTLANLTVTCPSRDVPLGTVLTLTKWKGTKTSWWDAFWAVIADHGRWVWPAARSMDGIDLSDEVVNGETKTINLDRSMSKMEDGSYGASITALGTEGAVPIQITVSKSDGHATPTVGLTQSLSPGLYLLEIKSYKGKPMSDGASGVLLVTSAANFDSYSSLYDRAVEQTADLGVLSSGSTRGQVLRAYLAALSSNLPETELVKLK
jgi:hypothetical protein